MADLGSTVLNRLHGGLVMDTQEDDEFGNPERRKRARHGRSYRGRRTATAERTVPEIRAATHVDFAPRPKDPSLMDHVLGVARAAREILVPQTPGEWAFEAATMVVPPAKLVSKIRKLVDATLPFAKRGYQDWRDVHGVYDAALREWGDPLVAARTAGVDDALDHPMPLMIGSGRRKQVVAEYDVSGELKKTTVRRPGAFYDHDSGIVGISEADSPFVLSHEAGHAADNLVGSDYPLRQGRQRYFSLIDGPLSGDAAFAQRKQLEALERAYPGSSPEKIRNMYVRSPNETRASLWGSYLQFPDSVPVFSEMADREMQKRGADPTRLRRRLERPGRYLPRLLGRR